MRLCTVMLDHLQPWTKNAAMAARHSFRISGSPRIASSPAKYQVRATYHSQCFCQDGSMQRRRSVKMAYRERWQAEIAELQSIVSKFGLREECKWGKPCYTMDGK